jgi:hypothetical protein
MFRMRCRITTHRRKRRRRSTKCQYPRQSSRPRRRSRNQFRHPPRRRSPPRSRGSRNRVRRRPCGRRSRPGGQFILPLQSLAAAAPRRQRRRLRSLRRMLPSTLQLHRRLHRLHRRLHRLHRTRSSLRAARHPRHPGPFPALRHRARGRYFRVHASRFHRLRRKRRGRPHHKCRGRLHPGLRLRARPCPQQPLRRRRVVPRRNVPLPGSRRLVPWSLRGRIWLQN